MGHAYAVFIVYGNLKFSRQETVYLYYVQYLYSGKYDYVFSRILTASFKL